MMPPTGFTKTPDEIARLRLEFHSCMAIRRSSAPNKFGQVGGFEYWEARARSAYRQLREYRALQPVPAQDVEQTQDAQDDADRLDTIGYMRNGF